jgi:hypothetical protein
MQSLSQIIEGEDWDSLALALISLPVDIKKENPKLRRIAKELEVIKHILYNQIMQMNGNNTMETSLYVGFVKSISRIEKKLDENGVQNSQFIMFLKLILEKFKKQKLSVKKPMEIREKFGKLKEVVEDAGTLRETNEDRS